MNNACPSCGAVYAVAAKDIGRKIRCKKCSSALRVTEAGLEFEGPTDPPAVTTSVPQVEEDYGDDDDVIVSKKKSRKEKLRGSQTEGMNVGQYVSRIGGVPTILFSIGVFLVILFTFQSAIGNAAIKRAAMGPKKLAAEMRNLEQAKLPKGKNSREELTEDEKKIYDGEVTKIKQEYAPKLREAQQDMEETEIDNVRSVRNDRYGVMFGFLFVAFGCIAYLRTEQPLVLRIVAGVILTFMMMVVFLNVGGCSQDKAPGLPL